MHKLLLARQVRQLCETYDRQRAFNLFKGVFGPLLFTPRQEHLPLYRSSCIYLDAKVCDSIWGHQMGGEF